MLTPNLTQNDSELLRSATTQEEEKGNDLEQGEAMTREGTGNSDGGMEKVESEVGCRRETDRL